MNFIYQLSFNWFLLYYAALGLILVIQGFMWIFKPEGFNYYIMEHAKKKETPTLIIKTLRYLLLFSGLSLVMSFLPFSMVELIFSAWSLVMVYILGSFFVKWDQLSEFILSTKHSFPQKIRRGGAMTLSLGVVMFLLLYHLVTSNSV